MTTEEHSVIGGLGSAVCEAVSESAPCPVVRHGVNDEFGRSAAALKVLEHYKVNAAGIVEKALEAVALKK